VRADVAQQPRLVGGQPHGVAHGEDHDKEHAGEEDGHGRLGGARQLLVQGGDSDIELRAEDGVLHALLEFRVFIEIEATIQAPESGGENADHSGGQGDLDDVEDGDRGAHADGVAEKGGHRGGHRAGGAFHRSGGGAARGHLRLPRIQGRQFAESGLLYQDSQAGGRAGRSRFGDVLRV